MWVEMFPLVVGYRAPHGIIKTVSREGKAKKVGLLHHKMLEARRRQAPTAAESARKAGGREQEQRLL